MPSKAESLCRDRRLNDVKRGVLYLRRTHDLAQRQWRHYGAVPAIKTRVIRDIGITTPFPEDTVSHISPVQNVTGVEKSGVINSVTNDPSVIVRRDEVTILQDSTSVTPRILVTEATPVRNLSTIPEMSSMNSETVSPEQKTEKTSGACSPGDSKISTFRSTYPEAQRDSQYQDPPAFSNCTTLPHLVSTSKDLQHSLREAHSLPTGALPSFANFNTWGSREWAVERKLEPDPQPKSYAPKRYPPMSRAAGQKNLQQRQLRTLTDFRSSNGTVRVIRPVPPIADIQNVPNRSALEQEENFDLVTLERERTYALLKRIDQLLEPTQAYFLSDLTSSQEVGSSTQPPASDLTDSLHETDDCRLAQSHSRGNKDHVHVHNESFLWLLNSSQGQCDHQRASCEHSGRCFHEQTFDHYNQTCGLSPRPFQRRSEASRSEIQPLHSSPVVGYHAYAFDKGCALPNRDRGRYHYSRYSSPFDKLRELRLEGSQVQLPAQFSRSSPKRLESSSLNAQSKFQGHGHLLNEQLGGKDHEVSRRAAAESLSEAVDRLQKKGVDRHLMCKDWIIKSFFT